MTKSKGQEYEPESLKVMQAALDRHLREEGCSYSILKDAEFSNSRKVLNGKAIVLQENGKGKDPGKLMLSPRMKKSVYGNVVCLEPATLPA